jgi:hypothetical protein
MDIQDDERLKELNDLIQKETDPKKVASLVDELASRIGELQEKQPKPAA